MNLYTQSVLSLPVFFAFLFFLQLYLTYPTLALTTYLVVIMVMWLWLFCRNTRQGGGEMDHFRVHSSQIWALPPFQCLAKSGHLPALGQIWVSLPPKFQNTTCAQFSLYLLGTLGYAIPICTSGKMLIYLLQIF